MKYYKISIAIDNSPYVFKAISEILNIVPNITSTEETLNMSQHEIWEHQIIETEEDKPVDFINMFLDILEPHFNTLKKIGITKDKITFWVNYEYYLQCSMEFSPQEMKRLGESGISLCIDCFEKRTSLTS